MRIAIWSVVLACCAASAFAQAPSADLLAHRKPVQSRGVLRAEVVNDGRAARDGDDWKTTLGASLEDAHASLTYDLGTPHDIRAAVLQGDSNDVYTLEGSDDGQHYRVLWEAGPVRAPGMRTRSSRDLQARARYVRVRASDGDGMFCISELQLFEHAPAAFPPPLRAAVGRSLDERVRDRALVFGLALLVPLFGLRRGSRRSSSLGLALPPLIALVQLAQAIHTAFPVGSREVSLVRGVIGAIACAAVARAAFSPRRWPAQRACVFGVLGVCALLAPLAFYNLGQPQFYSRGTGAWTFAHHLDLRQYYPTAKYFRELGYRHIYEADLAAYLDDHPELSFADIADLELRDLDTLEVVRARDRAQPIAAIEQRFSPERWREYRRDAAWFRAAMGDEYFDTLRDFGGNATPVWIGMAAALFAGTTPSELTFTLTGALDLLLLGAMFFAVQRSFGWFALLVTLVVFGANDFVMYGTNWSGATLRHDWLAYAGLGLCALRSERWFIAGVCLALAMVIRAFPALAFLGIGAAAILRVLERSWQRRALPSASELWRQERATLTIALGALACVVATWLMSLWVAPASAWLDWLAKVRQLESDPHPAVISLRNLVAGWREQQHFLHHRQLVYWAGVALYTGLSAACMRGKRPEQAAVLGLMLLPVLLYPANYYMHVVCLFPLLAALPDREPTLTDAGLWLIWLGLCAAQYFTVLVADLTLHFYLSSALLLTATFCVLALVLREELEHPRPDASGV